MCKDKSPRHPSAISVFLRYNVATLGAALAFQALQQIPSVMANMPGLFGFTVPGLTAALMLAGVSIAQLLAQICVNRGFTLTTASRGSTVTVSQVASLYQIA